MDKSLKKKLKYIFDYYGYLNQVAQLAEESGELIKAVNKYERYGETATPEERTKLEADILDEIADMTVMIEQFKIHHKISDSLINGLVEQKADRQVGRIMEKKYGNN